MAFTLTDADERKLVGVNIRLVTFMRALAAASPKKFIVTEGVRSRSRQQQLVREGKSKTLNSKHIIGRAVDIAPLHNGKVSWERKHFTPIIECARTLSAARKLPLAFGYDWGWDAPHIEMREP